MEGGGITRSRGGSIGVRGLKNADKPVLGDDVDDLLVDLDFSNGGGWLCPVRWACRTVPDRLRWSVADNPGRLDGRPRSPFGGIVGVMGCFRCAGLPSTEAIDDPYQRWTRDSQIGPSETLYLMSPGASDPQCQH
jgi:hypothetical protein